MIVPLCVLASYALASGSGAGSGDDSPTIEMTYSNGCDSHSKEDEALLFDGDANTYCESDGSHADAIYMAFAETQQISGVKITMTGYTGTVWLRARADDRHITHYGGLIGCIGGEFWDRPDQKPSDAMGKVTNGKQTWTFEFEELRDTDCFAMVMSPYAGNPRGVYSPRPRVYEIEFITTPPATKEPTAAPTEACVTSGATAKKKKQNCTNEGCVFVKATQQCTQQGCGLSSAGKNCGKKCCNDKPECFYHGVKKKCMKNEEKVCAELKGKNCKQNACTWNKKAKSCS